MLTSAFKAGLNIYKYIKSVIGFLLFFHPIVYAQDNFNFHHLDTFNGLPDNFVNDMFQDHLGYLWFCTDDGLMKFDGVKNVLYRSKKDDGNTISNSRVICANEDLEGNIWAGTSSGLDRINFKDGSINRFDTLSDKEIVQGQHINVIAVNHDGTVWVGTQAGLFKYIANENRFDYVLHREVVNRSGVLAGVCHKGIVFDKYGNIYVGLAGSIYVSRDNGKSFQELNLYHQTTVKNGEVWLSCIKIIGDDLWYADWGYVHVYKRNLKTGDQKEYVFNQTKFCEPTEVIYDICQRNNNELWVGGQRGIGKAANDIFTLNLKTNRIQKLNSEISQHGSLISGEIFTILKDKQGTMWLAGREGVDYFSPKFSSFRTSVNILTDLRSYQGGQVTAICQDNQHRIWVGSNINGLSCFNDSTYQFTRYKIPAQFSKDNKLNSIDAIFASQSGLIWLSTHGGVIQFDNKTNQFIKNEKNNSIKIIYPSEDAFVACFAEDYFGNIWMGLWQSGILKYDTKTGKIFRYSRFSKNSKFYIPHEWPACLSVDSSNNLWIGYNDYGGFAKWNLNTGKFDYYSPGTKENKLNDPTVFQIYPLKDKILFATNSGGLNICDSSLNSIKIFGAKEGLPGDRVNGIIKEDNKKFWLVTPSGLSHIDFDKNEIQNFYAYEISSRFNPDAFCITSKNHILVGSDNGLVIFTIPQANESSSQPPQITSFKVNGADFYQPYKQEPTRLKYWQNNFSFEFSSMNFIDPQTDRFAYKLEGYDKNWINAGDRKFVNYTNIPGGTYIFKIKVLNVNGLNKPQTNIMLIIGTAFYNTWWFYVLCAILVSYSVYKFYQYRIKQFLAMQTVRQKISTDLHDDIGSTLSSITLMSAVAKKKITTHPEEAIKLAQKMEDTSRQMIITMSDIVWSIKPGNDTLEQLISRLRDYMHNMMENNLKKYNLKTDDHILNTPISMNLKKDVYMIGKEIIHNASKYAEADCFEMLFEIKNNMLIINAVDNGKGFNESRIKKGNGINNIYQRTKNHNGICICNAKVGQGTKWLIKISLSA